MSSYAPLLGKYLCTHLQPRYDFERMPEALLEDFEITISIRGWPESWGPTPQHPNPSHFERIGFCFTKKAPFASTTFLIERYCRENDILIRQSIYGDHSCLLLATRELTPMIITCGADEEFLSATVL